MTISALIIRFFIIVAVGLALLHGVLYLFDVNKNSIGNAVIIGGAAYWQGLSFCRHNQEIFTNSEYKQVLFGMWGAAMIIYIAITFLKILATGIAPIAFLQPIALVLLGIFAVFNFIGVFLGLKFAVQEFNKSR